MLKGCGDVKIWHQKWNLLKNLVKGAEGMSEFLEVMMVLSFGAAWPVSIHKSMKARTAKGKSPFFLSIIIFGYACGIISKALADRINYVVIFYFINMVMVSVDLGLYFRNKKIDMLNGVTE